MGTLAKGLLFLAVSIIFTQIILSIVGLSVTQVPFTTVSLLVLVIFGSIIFFYAKVMAKGL